MTTYHVLVLLAALPDYFMPAPINSFVVDSYVFEFCNVFIKDFRNLLRSSARIYIAILYCTNLLELLILPFIGNYTNFITFLRGYVVPAVLCCPRWWQ